jgi:hypothetical protein
MHVAGCVCCVCELTMWLVACPLRRKTCRKLDQVKVVGSDKVVELWTRYATEEAEACTRPGPCSQPLVRCSS